MSHTTTPSRSRRRIAALGMGGILALGLGVAGLLALAVSGERGDSLPKPDWMRALADRDEVAYPLHAVAGAVLNLLGGPPAGAAVQWVKAAAHARSEADLRHAAAGIAAARERGGDAVDAVLCATATHGSPRVQVAISLGGLPCAANSFVRAHYPDGTPIEYGSRPPIGGPHYDAWYPSYGVTEAPVPAGRWLHNLEHGAVVLLYNCPEGCPSLVAELRALYARLPLGRNARSGRPRMVVTPYSDMDHRVAVVAWGHLLELDQLDADRITQFYVEHVDRGPECRNLSCTE